MCSWLKLERPQPHMHSVEGSSIALRLPLMTDEHRPEPTQAIPTKDGEPLVVPVPSRDAFGSVVRKVAGLRKRPVGKDQPPAQSESD